MQATFDPNALTLGVRTGLAISAGRTSISYGPQYAVVRTPQNPTYYMGNLLLCALALREWAVTTLIIVAKRDDFPRRIYAKCGFEEYQREAALWKPQRA